MTYWKVYCLEDKWPGLWRRCFQHQAASVGWPADWGYHLDGKSKPWSKARNALNAIQVGDKLVVQLRHHRIGRIGEITGLKVQDNQWDPLVPRSKEEPIGEMGRRILVRWDLVNGPLDPDLVVKLPPNARLTGGILRSTICELPPRLFRRIMKAATDKANWVGISSHVFRYEESISNFLGSFPHHLEDGLQPYPSMKVRESVFSDRTRSDVLLIDRNERPVIIECKQGTPTIANINQLRGYLRRAGKVIGKRVRGILVHGGAGKLSRDVKRHSLRQPRVEIVRYSLDVNFEQTL
ncbi:MAG: hypothetical protein A2Z34_01595 [Planctomycetes bacterium RBG_16_59_8]|nr:MAG: hypothetical protein A2Z34_01595 [Planctomycetes bacterium RBG_16_59_8]